MCFGGSAPKPPKPPPAPPPLPPPPPAPVPPPAPAPPPQPLQGPDSVRPTLAIGSSRRGDGQAASKRRGVSSLRQGSGVNAGSAGGMNL